MDASGSCLQLPPDYSSGQKGGICYVSLWICHQNFTEHHFCVSAANPLLGIQSRRVALKRPFSLEKYIKL